MNFSIRLARPSDAPQLPAIEHSAGELFRTTAGLEWIADDQGLSVEEHHEFIATRTSWIAVDGDDAPLAFLCADMATDALHIREISVHAHAQGTGIGRALIDHAEGVARSDGKRWLTLTTFRDVPWNEPYYARLGFDLLDDSALDARLAAILVSEVANGLPGERRCAMRRPVLAQSDRQS